MWEGVRALYGGTWKARRIHEQVHEKLEVTIGKKKSKSKVEYRRTEYLTRTIAKSVIKIIKKELIEEKWGSTPYNMLGVHHTTGVFLSRRVWARASAMTHVSLPDLVSCLSKWIWGKRQTLRNISWNNCSSIKVIRSLIYTSAVIGWLKKLWGKSRKAKIRTEHWKQTTIAGK